MNSLNCSLYGCDIEHIGDGLGLCVSCGGRFVLHQCSRHNGLSYYNGLAGFEGVEKWLPLLTPLISYSCPECSTAISLAEKAKQVPGAPNWVKELADGVEKVALVVGVVALAAVLFSPPRRA
jgi:hypothetical protein